MNVPRPFSNTKIFKTRDLVPGVWLNGSKGDDFYAFNPAITIFRGESLMAYRIVGPDARRCLAVCRLDEHWDIKAGSLVPLSDHLLGAGDWHADPRFCVFGDRLLMHCNDGFRRPNRISLVELDPDTLFPKGPARPLLMDSPRQEVEKNWTLFEHDGALLAVYSIAPHIILRVFPDAGGDSIPCTRIHEDDWDSSAYSSRFGVLRGGTPPIRVGNLYFSFFHSLYSVSSPRRLLHRIIHGRGTRTCRYAIGFYGFSASPPFRAQSFAPIPVMLPPRSNLAVGKQLNRKVDRVVYPCGAVFLDGLWAVSFGIHDAQCGIRLFSHEKLSRLSLSITSPARNKTPVDK